MSGADAEGRRRMVIASITKKITKYYWKDE
jgi:hypothetical protein